MSIESEVLRGGTYGVGATRDCISTKRGRVPSRAGMITVPDSLLFSSDQNILEASGTSTRPVSRISKIPISLVLPKRFFLARQTRYSALRSPSK